MIDEAKRLSEAVRVFATKQDPTDRRRAWVEVWRAKNALDAAVTSASSADGEAPESPAIGVFRGGPGSGTAVPAPSVDDAGTEHTGSTLTRPKFGADGSITNLDELSPPVPSGVDESAWCSRCGHSIGMHDEGPCRGIVDRGEGDEVNCSCHGMEFKPASDSAETPGSRPRLARRIADAMQRYVDRHASDERQDGDWMFAVALSVLTADAADKASVETEDQR